jgi:hypothetical protein
MTVVVVGRVDELQELEGQLSVGKMTGTLDPSSVTAHILLDCHIIPHGDEYDDDDVNRSRSNGVVVASDFHSSAGCLFSAKEHCPETPCDATSHSDSTQSTENTSLQRRRRHVRFDTDSSDRVVEHVFRYRAVSDRRKDKCYMSKAELSEAVEQANRFAKSYASMHEDWHGTIESLLLSSSSDDGSDNVHDDNDDNDDDDTEAILILTESSARGLEFSSRLLQKHQEWANRSVLRRCHQLAARARAGCDNDADGTSSSKGRLDDDGAAELLRERCEHVNRFTRRLAVHLARGDAIQAQIVYEEDGTWARWKGE